MMNWETGRFLQFIIHHSSFIIPLSSVHHSSFIIPLSPPVDPIEDCRDLSPQHLRL
jgi:hypothetical protein